MRKTFYKWPLIVWLFILCIGCNSARSETRVREATHADGMWYPSKASELKETVDSYLANAKAEPVKGKIMALIVPHAGYRFCGQVAAYAYRQIKGMEFDTVVLVGPSHQFGFRGASVYEEGVYRNPLGDVEIDSVIAKQLMAESDSIQFAPRVHESEHCLENQIPFLQRALSKFRIVPIVMGDSGEENCNMLAKALAKVLKGKNVLLIASTDMCHYPAYDEAVKADRATISALETLKPDLIRKRLDEYLGMGVDDLKCMLCGRGAVLTVMAAAEELGVDSIKVLKYANSGDVPIGDKERVVGYMAAMLFDSKGSGEGAASEAMDTPLNEEQQEVLLKLARESIGTYLETGKKKHLESNDERLNVKQGAFVTLRKEGMLRGCIGHIVPIEALCDTVADMAVAAATEDPRFPSVSMKEMKDIDIEISVLSIPRRVENADEIEMGKHGVIVRRGMRQGVFLPQVATETGWDRQTFLEHLCSGKAGLPKDAWKDKDTELYSFTAQLFEEE